MAGNIGLKIFATELRMYSDLHGSPELKLFLKTLKFRGFRLMTPGGTSGMDRIKAAAFSH
jgi:hypothetical protein